MLLTTEPLFNYLDDVRPSASEENAEAMQQWRKNIQTACQEVIEEAKGKFDKKALRKKEQVEAVALSLFRLPEPDNNLRGYLPTGIGIGYQKYDYCKNTFIDLGTNIGDSIGYFVDTAIDVCSPLWIQANPKTAFNKDFPRPHLDVTTRRILGNGLVANPLFNLLQSHMSNAGNNGVVLPENTCVYGMEGNPAFSERLQKLENFIMSMHPRPVQHLHIHTESVVSAVDGPTKLFLDTTSVKQNVRVGMNFSVASVFVNFAVFVKLGLTHAVACIPTIVLGIECFE
jgi:hypothetical protein